jgi:hypothetical protein
MVRADPRSGRKLVRHLRGSKDSFAHLLTGALAHLRTKGRDKFDPAGRGNPPQFCADFLKD